jgi:hypothetical protein
MNALDNLPAAEQELIGAIDAAAAELDKIATVAVGAALERLQAAAERASMRVAAAKVRANAIVSTVVRYLDIVTEQVATSSPEAAPVNPPSIAAELESADCEVFHLTDGPPVESTEAALPARQDVQGPEQAEAPATTTIAPPEASHLIQGPASAVTAACSPVDGADRDDRKPLPTAPTIKPKPRRKTTKPPATS